MVVLFFDVASNSFLYSTWRIPVGENASPGEKTHPWEFVPTRLPWDGGERSKEGCCCCCCCCIFYGANVPVQGYKPTITAWAARSCLVLCSRPLSRCQGRRAEALSSMFPSAECANELRALSWSLCPRLCRCQCGPFVGGWMECCLLAGWSGWSNQSRRATPRRESSKNRETSMHSLPSCLRNFQRVRSSKDNGARLGLWSARPCGRRGLVVVGGGWAGEARCGRSRVRRGWRGTVWQEE